MSAHRGSFPTETSDVACTIPASITRNIQYPAGSVPSAGTLRHDRLRSHHSFITTGEYGHRPRVATMRIS